MNKPIVIKAKTEFCQQDSHSYGPTIKVDLACTSHPEVSPRFGYVLPDTPRNRKLAERLVAAIDSQAAVPNTRILTDLNGKQYVTFDMVVFGKYMNADLKKLGY